MTSSDSPAPASRPFAAAPDVDRYFPSAAIEESRQRIGRAIRRGEGPVLVVGTAGLGKTLLLEVIARQFSAQLKPVTLVGGQVLTRRAMLQMILFQLGLPYQNMDESELRLALLSHLRPADSDPRRMLLLVDEADALAPRLLEELRGLTNLAVGGHVQVSLVLAGNGTLEEQFADPKLHLFSQRVSARCYLSPLGRGETISYVQAQVAAAGHAPASLFTDESLDAIFAATDGVVRLINQLCDQLMWTVEETGYTPLDAAIVQQAWSELQQLPAPWNTQTHEATSSAVEFGDLETSFPADDVPPTSELACEFDFDEDLPASIPISSSTPAIFSTDATSHVGENHLEQAERLLNELQADDAPAEHATRNPFDEDFQSEEMVLDRYSSFESLLLDAAPRVANSADAHFSAQLQQLEATDASIAELALPQLVESSGGCTVIETSAIETTDEADEPSELLVIEDADPADRVVVSGQKFRQLFSSLENAVDQPCYG